MEVLPGTDILSDTASKQTLEGRVLGRTEYPGKKEPTTFAVDSLDILPGT